MPAGQRKKKKKRRKEKEEEKEEGIFKVRLAEVKRKSNHEEGKTSKQKNKKLA